MDLTALLPHQTYVYTKSCQKKLRKSTKGWKLLVAWKDGNEQWVNLEFMKQYYPIETAEFAIAHGPEDLPQFKWWMPFTLCNRDRIVSAVKARVRKAPHKYGIEVLTSVEHAKRLDHINGNRDW